MKQLKLTLTLCAALLVGVSCNSEKGASKVAQEFLAAYFQTDYRSAVTYCDGDIAASLQEAIKERENMDPSLLEAMMEASRKTSYDIITVDTESESGKATISYQVHSIFTDIPIDKQLTLTRKGLGKWVITGMK